MMIGSAINSLELSTSGSLGIKQMCGLTRKVSGAGRSAASGGHHKAHENGEAKGFVGLRLTVMLGHGYWFWVRHRHDKTVPHFGLISLQRVALRRCDFDARLSF